MLPMHLPIKIAISTILLLNLSSHAAECAIRFCPKSVSCFSAKEIIDMVGEHVFIDNFFDPLINSSSAMMMRHPASRMVNMAYHEKLKSKGYEAMGRLEWQRYYLSKKEALLTDKINRIKAIRVDTELMQNALYALRSEMLLYLVSDGSTERVARHKRHLLEP